MIKKLYFQEFIILFVIKIDFFYTKQTIIYIMDYDKKLKIKGEKGTKGTKDKNKKNVYTSKHIRAQEELKNKNIKKN
jgi:hypothetical protein